MNERAKITASHLSRQAIVYLRQSSAAQVENNRESTDRQYALAAKARELGWPADRIVVIDEDLGLSGSGYVARSGFARLTAEVALAHVGLVLGLEVSRLARNNADWHRLIELGGLTDTLIGDADGIYHPALFNDRLLLGLKGAMSEAELHVLRARLNGGIRNKAARGELRRWHCHGAPGLRRSRWPGSRTRMNKISYSGYRFPPEIIQQAIALPPVHPEPARRRRFIGGTRSRSTARSTTASTTPTGRKAPDRAAAAA